MKRKFFKSIAVWLGVKEAQEYPGWLLFLFFPIKYLLIRNSYLKYDFVGDVYTIDGVSVYAGAIHLLGALTDGEYLLRVKRQGDVVYVDQVTLPSFGGDHWKMTSEMVDDMNAGK
jgi:hypothetical protein